MPSEFLLDSHHDNGKHPCPSSRLERLENSQESTHQPFGEATESSHSSETLATRISHCTFGTPTPQAYTQIQRLPCIDGFGLSLERQAAREEVGMTRVQADPSEFGKERGIIAMCQQNIIHLVCTSVGKQKQPVGHVRESISQSVGTLGQERDAQNLISEEQHVAFTEPTSRKQQDQPSERGIPPILALETSESSSLESFSGHPRKTPYPSPVALGELIMQQANEETDGSNDDNPNTDFTRKKVRVVNTSSSTPLPSSSSFTSTKFKAPMNSTTTLTRLSSGQKRKGNRLDRAIKQIFFKRPTKGNLGRSGKQMSFSGSSYTTVVGNIPPTLPQGGTHEISTSRKLPPLMIQGLERDFLPSEVTFVSIPQAQDTPILGAPLSFNEAVSTLPIITDPTPASSEANQPGVSLENTASPELTLTRPLPTQGMNVVAPFFKMGGNFPPPPTPPLPKVCDNHWQFEEIVKLPKLDTHGLLQDRLGHQKKAVRRMGSATASVKAFFAKPFTNWEKKDLVASVSNDKDKESAGVGIKDRYFRDTTKKANFAAHYPVLGGTGSRSLTSSPVSRFMRRASFPAVRESYGAYATPSPQDQESKFGVIEHATEEMNSDAIRKQKVTMVVGTCVEKDSLRMPHTTAEISAAGVSSDHTLTLSHLPELYFPTFDTSPSPPSPILRPASTIPTTVKHERRGGSSSISSLPVYVEQERVEKPIDPLPLLPLKGNVEYSMHQPSLECAPTPPPSVRTICSTPTTGTNSQYSSELLNRGWVRYTCDSGKGTLGEVIPKRGSIRSEATTTSTAGSVPLQPRSRGDSGASERSWESGGTTLDMEEMDRAMLGIEGSIIVTMGGNEAGSEATRNLDSSSLSVYGGERVD